MGCSRSNGKPCKIFYARRPEFDTADAKLNLLSETKFTQIDFEHITPDNKNNWINQTDNDFDSFLPLVDKDVKCGKAQTAVFQLFSRGIATQRDEWAYDLSKKNIADEMKFFVPIYQSEFNNQNQAEFSQSIKWDKDLRSYFKRRIKKEFDELSIKLSLYRPFCKEYLYFDKHLNGRTYQWFSIYHDNDTEKK